MIPNNNLSVLPWYSSIEQQNARKWWINGRIYPLFCPLNYILPFQIMREHRSGDTISSFKIYTKDGVLVDDYTTEINQELTIVPFATMGYDVIVYSGANPAVESFNIGQYYAVLNDGTETWYSEIFTVVEDMSGYLKLQWWDNQDFIMSAGRIVYRYGDNEQFKNTIYLQADIAKPEYLFDEEVIERDGYSFPVKQISEKRYHFAFWASEYLLDVLRFVRMADVIRITKNGQEYDADSFLISPTWEDNGDVAAVNAEFDTDTVAKKIPSVSVSPTPPPPSEHYLRVTPTILSFLAEGEEQNLVIESNTSWEIVNLPIWISVKEGQSASGSGNAQITLVAAENQMDERTQTIAVSGTDVATVNVSVTQVGSEPNISLIDLTGSIGGAGGVVKAYVRSNKNWNTRIMSGSSAVTDIDPITGEASSIYTEVQITIDENPSTSATREVVVRFECTDYPDTYQEFTITQEASEVEHVLHIYNHNGFDNFETVNADAALIYPDLTASGNWTVTSNVSWITPYQSGSWHGGKASRTALWCNIAQNTGATRQGILTAVLDGTGISTTYIITQLGSGSQSYLQMAPVGTKNVDYDVITQYVDVISNVDWRASAGGGASIDKTSGRGNDTITMTFPKNNTASPIHRTMEIHSVGVTPQITHNLDVVQAIQPSVDPYLNVEPSVLEFDSVGETKRVVITTNGSWSMNTSLIPSWLHLSVTSGTAGTTNVDITADELMSYSPREVVLRFMGAGPTAVGTLSVHQNGAQGYKVVLENTAYGAEKINNTTFKARGGSGAFLQMHIRRSYVMGSPADILQYVVKSQNGVTVASGQLTWHDDEYESIPVLYDNALFDHDELTAAYIEITGTSVITPTEVRNGIINIWPSTAPIE